MTYITVQNHAFLVVDGLCPSCPLSRNSPVVHRHLFLVMKSQLLVSPDSLCAKLKKPGSGAVRTGRSDSNLDEFSERYHVNTAVICQSRLTKSPFESLIQEHREITRLKQKGMFRQENLILQKVGALKNQNRKPNVRG